MRLTVTTTALPRPDLFRQTIDSFKKHLQGVDWAESTIVLNIDPFPTSKPTPLTGESLAVLSQRLEEMSDKTTDVCCIAAQHFGRVIGLLWEQRLAEEMCVYGPKTLWRGDSVCWPMTWPLKGNFPAAVKRVFEAAAKLDNSYVLHLEDDWEMVEDVAIERLTGALDCGWQQAALRPLRDCQHHQFVLCPSLLRKETAADVAALIDPKCGNPEVQVRENNPMFRTRTLMVGEAPLLDLGTAWRDAHGYVREDDSWREREGIPTALSK